MLLLLLAQPVCAGEKEPIDCGQLDLEIFNALKDEFKVNTAVFLKSAVWHFAMLVKLVFYVDWFLPRDAMHPRY